LFADPNILIFKAAAVKVAQQATFIIENSKQFMFETSFQM